MRPVIAWLGRHPLVWVIPLAFYLTLFGYMVWTLPEAPATEFIYDF